jgi:hypothetical protein
MSQHSIADHMPTTEGRGGPAAPHRPASDRPRRIARDGAQGREWVQILIAVLAALAIITAGLMLYWSRQPRPFDVRATVEQMVSEEGGYAAPGTAMAAVSVRVAETLLEKPGGFLYNDAMPPGALMDNMPSWECGVMMALRDVVQALRNDFTRSQSQSVENADVKRADLQFAIDPASWLVPAAEDQYRKGIDALRIFLADLSGAGSGTAAFYPRADNLADYLSLVEKRLGNFAVRLSGSIGDADLSGAVLGRLPAAGADGEPDALSPAAPGGAREMGPAHRTEPGKIDNVFYCARGYSWASLHFMRAVAIDFAPVLASKNAEVAVQQMVRDLEGANKPMRSPIVLNGQGFGLVANHSLVVASYISRVNAAVIDLKILLQQG